MRTGVNQMYLLRRLGCVGVLAIVLSVAGCSVTGGLSSPPTAGSGVGSTAPDRSASASPTAQSSTAQSSTAPSASSGDASTGTAKPSPDVLQPALASYFQDQDGMDPDIARKAATCAVYPAFQELSAPSLRAIVAGHPQKIRAADEKVFGDVVTECETASR